MIPSSRERGFTLTELLVALVVSVIVIAGALGLHVAQQRSFRASAGDRALQLFAGVLEENVRGHDIVARFGGEEFVLVYPEMSDMDEQINRRTEFRIKSFDYVPRMNMQ